MSSPSEPKRDPYQRWTEAEEAIVKTFKDECVYLISDGYACKVGRTRNLLGRMNDLKRVNLRESRGCMS
ncbi:hypothetical protein [Leptolyngbya sp. FACHB-261]|uniref:hypothetical protein n=1 Tax=Leptolyngbya sp. FACHB-261 TaxID=2692806 RepID=UPI001683DBF3|nr:hypothetical protein [Leptolyngbya sp. FACHB-261]MBD2099997.1 hypothetical protein [Leptolyngbya sp. FACHB-261]